MPVHDWTRVEAGIFHDFHHAWIEEIKRSLNSGRLPSDYYALAEQFAGGLGPDVLTLQERSGGTDRDRDPAAPNGGGVEVARPRARITAETDMDFYRRKQNVVAVRRVSGDRVVAIIEIVSPGNKSSRKAFTAFVAKATDLLDRQINLLIADLIPPTPRDPQGIHGAIWEEITAEPFTPPTDKPLTLVAYESDVALRAYIEPIAVGDVLPDMPIFLELGRYVRVPLEETYRSAFDAVPRRWRRVLDADGA